MSINETVLEMHYHRPLMDLFRRTYGLGETGMLNFYKYSPQREVFVGFDQAYARSELSEQEFFDLLKGSATSESYKINDKFIGYFLQFKVVYVLKRKMKHTPVGINSTPYYRASLDTKRNANTGFSQHELLFRLSRNAGAFVYYACPMLFDRSDLYDIEVDLETLRLPDLKTCPAEYSDNKQHYIYFNDRNGVPVWCSQPTDGEAIGPETLAKLLFEKANDTDAKELAATLLDLLTNVEKLGPSPSDKPFTSSDLPPSMLHFLSNILTVIRIGKNRDNKH